MKQAVVNRYVDDLAYTLGVERDALNVVRLYPPYSYSTLTLVFSHSLSGCSCEGSCSRLFRYY